MAPRHPARKSLTPVRDTVLPEWEPIDLTLLEVSPRLQPRVRIEPALVEEYCSIFRSKTPDTCTCPAIIVYVIHGSYMVADGHHRVTAARKAGRTQLHAHIIRDPSKTLEDAWVHTMQINITNGISYTGGDKSKVAAWLVTNPAYAHYSPTDLERLCKGRITDQTFANYRKRLKMGELEKVSTLEKGVRSGPTLAQQLTRLTTEVERMEKSAVFLRGLVRDMPEAAARLEPLMLAVRQALVTVQEEIDRMRDMDNEGEGEEGETDVD